MDFITELPNSMRQGNIYDAVFVVVDHYTKYARYIPAQKNWDTEQFVDVMVDKVFTEFGMPISITSDRGSIFLSKLLVRFLLLPQGLPWVQHSVSSTNR